MRSWIKLSGDPMADLRPAWVGVRGSVWVRERNGQLRGRTGIVVRAGRLGERDGGRAVHFPRRNGASELGSGMLPGDVHGELRRETVKHRGDDLGLFESVHINKLDAPLVAVAGCHRKRGR
nr:hypothetical protein CFP56_22438 [Quercus suber]